MAQNEYKWNNDSELKLKKLQYFDDQARKEYGLQNESFKRYVKYPFEIELLDSGDNNITTIKIEENSTEYVGFKVNGKFTETKAHGSHYHPFEHDDTYSNNKAAEILDKITENTKCRVVWPKTNAASFKDKNAPSRAWKVWAGIFGAVSAILAGVALKSIFNPVITTTAATATAAAATTASIVFPPLLIGFLIAFMVLSAICGAYNYYKTQQNNGNEPSLLKTLGMTLLFMIPFVGLCVMAYQAHKSDKENGKDGKKHNELNKALTQDLQTAINQQKQGAGGQGQGNKQQKQQQQSGDALGKDGLDHLIKRYESLNTLCDKYNEQDAQEKKTRLELFKMENNNNNITMDVAKKEWNELAKKLYHQSIDLEEKAQTITNDIRRFKIDTDKNKTEIDKKTKEIKEIKTQHSKIIELKLHDNHSGIGIKEIEQIPEEEIEKGEEDNLQHHEKKGYTEMNNKNNKFYESPLLVPGDAELNNNKNPHVSFENLTSPNAKSEGKQHIVASKEIKKEIKITFIPDYNHNKPEIVKAITNAALPKNFASPNTKLLIERKSGSSSYGYDVVCKIAEFVDENGNLDQNKFKNITTDDIKNISKLFKIENKTLYIGKTIGMNDICNEIQYRLSQQSFKNSVLLVKTYGKDSIIPADAEKLEGTAKSEWANIPEKKKKALLEKYDDTNIKSTDIVKLEYESRRIAKNNHLLAKIKETSQTSDNIIVQYGNGHIRSKNNTHGVLETLVNEGHEPEVYITPDVKIIVTKENVDQVNKVLKTMTEFMNDKMTPSKLDAAKFNNLELQDLRSINKFLDNVAKNNVAKNNLAKQQNKRQ